jgi:hypothetical protein
MNSEEKSGIFVRFMASEESRCCHIFKRILTLRQGLHMLGFIFLPQKIIFSLMIQYNA